MAELRAPVELVGQADPVVLLVMQTLPSLGPFRRQPMVVASAELVAS